MMRLKRVIEGLTVVAVGCILLANTVGALSWRVWLDVLALWPLLIVAVGIEIVGMGLGRDWVRALASAVILAGLVYAVASSVAGAGTVTARQAGRDAAGAFSFSEPASAEVERGVATVRGGAGAVSVAAGSDLVRARGRSPFEPAFDVRREGATARVEVSLASRPHAWTGRMAPTELEVELGREVLWDLAIEAGAAELEADLKEVRLSRLRVDAGASESTLEFGAPEGKVPVDLRTGASSVTLRFPRDAAFRVRVLGALAAVESAEAEELPSSPGERTYRHGDSDSSDWYDVSVQAGVSRVKIELY
ncbi:MAG: DUF5668 domain-containing protein [Coriobacteriia bacterium]|nr:DUF5668 domain-containing protein [Coriobacteriia bacterium]